MNHSIKFDHDAATLPEAMGVSSERTGELIDKVMDSIKDGTKVNRSTILEHCLSQCDTMAEVIAVFDLVGELPSMGGGCDGCSGCDDEN